MVRGLRTRSLFVLLPVFLELSKLSAEVSELEALKEKQQQCLERTRADYGRLITPLFLGFMLANITFLNSRTLLDTLL